MRCRLCLPMFAVSVHLSVCSSVCLSCGSTRLHCAKTAEEIKMPFGMNTPRYLRNIVLDGGPDPPTARGGVFEAAFAKLLWPLSYKGEGNGRGKCERHFIYEAALSQECSGMARIIIIIIIIQVNVYSAVIMTYSHCESSLGSSDECGSAPDGANPQTKPVDLGRESVCIQLPFATPTICCFFSQDHQSFIQSCCTPSLEQAPILPPNSIPPWSP